MKLGIFSGTFDPVHEGHVLFALTACDQFDLDRVLLMPERKPRRKKPTAAYEQRVEMLSLAISDYPQLEVLESESDHHDVSRTLREVVEKYDDTKLTLLMGADVFEFIPSWAEDGSRLAQLLAQVEFIVALRTEDDGEIVMPLADKINANVQFISAPISGVSSSTIRAGEFKYLDDKVMAFIKTEKIYDSTSSQ